VLVGILAVMALVLSATGLYGVTAHGVNQRTQEIGIRTSLGATPFRVIGFVLKESSIRVLLGLTFGLTAAVFLTDLTSRVLYAVEPNDLLTFVLTSMLLVLVALTASILPARRAARLNPLDALRID
jgi:ABC-type antimicrobial peptide transport system permease subunit